MQLTWIKLRQYAPFRNAKNSCFLKSAIIPAGKMYFSALLMAWRMWTISKIITSILVN